MGKRFYWLKLQKNFFNQPTIKKLRRIAGGDTYTIIYLKMQLLSIDDDGKLYFTGLEDDFAEEIALAIDEDTENVRVTLAFLERVGLAEYISDAEISLPEACANTGSEVDSARRVRECRERQKQALQSAKNSNKRYIVTGERYIVQKSNTEIEKEKEKGKETELKKEKEISSLSKSPAPKINYQEILDAYNTLCPSLHRCTVLSDKRRQAIQARIKSGYKVDDFKAVFSAAEKSKFLRGANNRNWTASFDWLIKDANMAKVLDGNYDDWTDGGGDNGRGQGTIIAGGGGRDVTEIPGGIQL